jgi:thioredoxin 2
MNSLIIACQSCGKKNKIPAGKQHLLAKCGQCGSPISLSGKAVPVELDDNGFHDFIKQASLPVMVDFFSPTCGPCRQMTPVVDALARKYIHKCIIAKIDTSRHVRTPSLLQIKGVPSFLFFKNGELVDRVVGAAPESDLDRKIRSLC